MLRTAALTAAAATAGAAALSLAACGVGVSSASPGLKGFGVPVGGLMNLSGSTEFPVPPKTAVMDDSTNRGKEHGNYAFVLGRVSAARAYRFYTRVLPKNGWTITSAGSVGGGAVAAIEFHGHGYKGEIGAVGSMNLAGRAGTIGVELTQQ